MSHLTFQERRYRSPTLPSFTWDYIGFDIDVDSMTLSNVGSVVEVIESARVNTYLVGSRHRLSVGMRRSIMSYAGSSQLASGTFPRNCGSIYGVITNVSDCIRSCKAGERYNAQTARSAPIHLIHACYECRISLCNLPGALRAAISSLPFR